MKKGYIAIHERRGYMNNEELQPKYEEMHEQGSSSWFGDGKEERELILKMGEPWTKKGVIEIGCGEGLLATQISLNSMYVHALDYSEIAISKAILKYPMYSNISWENIDYRKKNQRFDRIVMQGVLEHLDDSFKELKWMMDNLLTKEGDVITSSPCFLNPRGIVWMTLDMVGALMSKTDLHFLNPWEFEEFSQKNGYQIITGYCNISWASHDEMIEDFLKRIPLALVDANLNWEFHKFAKFIGWLEKVGKYILSPGATAVYKMLKKK